MVKDEGGAERWRLAGMEGRLRVERRGGREVDKAARTSCV